MTSDAAEPTTVGVVYLDAPVFISAVSGSVPLEQRGESSGLIGRVDGGGLKAVVSTFCIAEVRRLSDDGSNPNFSEEEAERVRRMFREGNLQVWPLTEHIAERARDIGNKFPKLLPGDCVHIATAVQFGVDALFTRDGSGLEGRRRPGHDAVLRPSDRRAADSRTVQSDGSASGPLEAESARSADRCTKRLRAVR